MNRPSNPNYFREVLDVLIETSDYVKTWISEFQDETSTDPRNPLITRSSVQEIYEFVEEFIKYFQSKTDLITFDPRIDCFSIGLNGHLLRLSWGVKPEEDSKPKHLFRVRQLAVRYADQLKRARAAAAPETPSASAAASVPPSASAAAAPDPPSSK